MKKNYAAPKMDVVELKKENMILTSGCLKNINCDEQPFCPGLECLNCPQKWFN